MSDEDAKLIRPSSLPKLAECRCFVSSGGTSEAAERGTRLDGVIREGWMKFAQSTDRLVNLNDCFAVDGLSEDDVKAVMWAAATMARLCNDKRGAIETREEQLQAVVPVAGIKPGTMDGLCVEHCFLIDFKTGQERNYREQMAAYALACMDAYFAPSWTAHLLFVDQQIVVTHEFTEAEARQIVEDVVNAPVVATGCEYCPWCGIFGSCELTRRQVADVVELATELASPPTPHEKSVGALPPSLDDIAADDRKAWEFLAKFAIMEKWVEIVKSKAKDRVAAAGGKSAYFSLGSRRGKSVFPARGFDDVIGEVGNMAVLSILGPASEKDARELWEKRVSRKPFPADRLVEQGASVVLTRRTPKQVAAIKPEED